MLEPLRFDLYARNKNRRRSVPGLQTLNNLVVLRFVA